jgi:hypothetical protein
MRAATCFHFCLFLRLSAALPSSIPLPVTKSARTARRSSTPAMLPMPGNSTIGQGRSQIGCAVTSHGNGRDDDN